MAVAPNMADYDEAREHFSWDGARDMLGGLPGGRGINIAHEAVDRHATGPLGAKPALRFVDRRFTGRDITYAELAALSSRFANVLRALDMGRDDSVFVLLGPTPALYIAVLRALKNNNLVCPLFAGFGPEPIRLRLAIGGARALVTTAATSCPAGSISAPCGSWSRWASRRWFRAYLHDQRRYDDCFAGGWYLSGDVARQDADGYFWFVARADDMIKSAGHLIGPFEVESALLEHPAVVEAGVIGIPDPVAGERVKAFVTLGSGYGPTDSRRLELIWCRTRLGAAVAPREISFDQHLPHTTSGKVMRRRLRSRELGLPDADASWGETAG